MIENQTQAAPGMMLAFSGLVRPVLVSAVFFMAVTGLIYPLAITGAAHMLFRDQAQGSLVVRDGQAIGSRVIGQYFTQPQYFHGRPSMTSGVDPRDPDKSIEQPYNAANSGASNQGVLSKKLLDAVAERVQAYRNENGLAADAKVPVDAVTASASGLDPHISLANASLQLARVAKARHVPEQDVRLLLEKHTAQRQLGVFGEPRVNVLELNLALDEAFKARPVAQ